VKTRFILSSIFVSLVFSSVVNAESYLPPELKLPQAEIAPHKHNPTNTGWRSNSRVQDTPAPERNVASDEWVDTADKEAAKKAKRDPSSLKDEVKAPTPAGIKPWKFEPPMP